MSSAQAAEDSEDQFQLIFTFPLDFLTDRSCRRSEGGGGGVLYCVWSVCLSFTSCILAPRLVTQAQSVFKGIVRTLQFTRGPAQFESLAYSESNSRPR